MVLDECLSIAVDAHLNEIAKKGNVLPEYMLLNIKIIILCLNRIGIFWQHLPMTITIDKLVEGLVVDLYRLVDSEPALSGDIWITSNYDEMTKLGPYAIYLMIRDYWGEEYRVNNMKYVINGTELPKQLETVETRKFFGLHDRLSKILGDVAKKCEYKECKILYDLFEPWEWETPLISLVSNILSTSDYYSELFKFFEWFEFIFRTCIFNGSVPKDVFKKMKAIRLEVLKAIGDSHITTNTTRNLVEYGIGVYSELCYCSVTKSVLDRHNCKAKKIFLNSFFVDHTFYLEDENFYNLLDKLVSEFNNNRVSVPMFEDFLSSISCGNNGNDSYFYNTLHVTRDKLETWTKKTKHQIPNRLSSFLSLSK